MARAGGFVSKIVFNDGSGLRVNSGDIVVLVGPNNAGKSQALQDIHILCEERRPTIVVRDIGITKTPGTLVAELLESISVSTPHAGYTSYSGFGFSCNSRSIDSFASTYSFGPTRNAFVSYLNTEQRLSICHPPALVNRDAARQHPIHYVLFDASLRKTLATSFRKAFGIDLIPNALFGPAVPLCMGEPISLVGEEYKDEQERQEAYGERLSAYRQVHKQGDGIRSFVGILLNLMISHYCTFLIDEPESFLHPPQSYIISRVIGESLKHDQQAFIATHSQEVIKGLLDTCPGRVRIIRITRNDDTNSFATLDSDTIKNVWSDSLLKHSNILNGMFHQSVVLCESDADCRLYSIVQSRMKEDDGQYPETLFVHCGGKQRMPKIIDALRALRVDIRVVADIDVLNDEAILKPIVESCGGVWDSYKRDHGVLCSHLRNQRDRLARSSLQTEIHDLLSRSTDEHVHEAEAESIRSMLKPRTKWAEVKSSGVAAIPPGDATNAFHNLDVDLRKIGVFVVPCGEIEGFIREVGGHGPEWVNRVLERYPDPSSSTYSRIREFIRTWNV